ncbi:MAG TPA: Smr/MutS family protein, partial [Beijerinckiaceae bacterium]|nr:Smr/MutS family protein [Beijerinckiaceae bacterium]
HGALVAFIHRAQASGASLVVIVTGKGAPGLDSERGVLRRLVPHWLADPALRRCIVGFEPAGRGHGGDGALYVRIRRP